MFMNASRLNRKLKDTHLILEIKNCTDIEGILYYYYPIPNNAHKHLYLYLKITMLRDHHSNCGICFSHLMHVRLWVRIIAPFTHYKVTPSHKRGLITYDYVSTQINPRWYSNC